MCIKAVGNQEEEPQLGHSVRVGQTENRAAGKYEVQSSASERTRSFGICCVLLAFLLCSAGIPPACSSEVNIGVCWGRNSWQPLPPQTVVQLLQDNGITKLKLFGADSDIMGALVGTDIEVEAMVSNEYLSVISNSVKDAQSWFYRNVFTYLYSGGVNVKYIAVGNEPFLQSNNGEYDSFVVPALLNLYAALQAKGLDSTIKLVVPMNLDILSNSYPPSAASIRPDIVQQITDIAQFLHQTGSSFSVNIYPFLTVYQQPYTSPIPLGFVMKMSSIPTINDKAVPGAFQDPGNKLFYSNIFDGAYDAMVTVLANLGYPDVEVTIGEIGWPTDGEGDNRGYASPDLAETFNNYIIRHFASGRGTPQRPNITINGYLFSLLDENNKSTGAGSFERHWGIFTSDGTPKYPLDLTGSGQPMDLVPAKNVTWLPRQWCVARKNATLGALSAAVGFACGAQASDCTATVEGGSCYFNGDLRNISSYSFNSYFQLHNQDASSCNFGGSAAITTEDPSSGNCTFPIGIIPQTNGGNCRYLSLLVQVFAVLWVSLV